MRSPPLWTAHLAMPSTPCCSQPLCRWSFKSHLCGERPPCGISLGLQFLKFLQQAPGPTSLEAYAQRGAQAEMCIFLRVCFRADDDASREVAGQESFLQVPRCENEMSWLCTFPAKEATTSIHHSALCKQQQAGVRLPREATFVPEQVAELFSDFICFTTIPSSAVYSVQFKKTSHFGFDRTPFRSLQEA
eukprot:TRINITY_DN12536_c0_g1_i1.p3 TRINITY_DN12536_c0_g1~~TRINITY_DN12536_c0_g1_i1.p3  ORF type:complete len:190 (+),score=30.70 TRINITY_DN12536_c0_g1_i1:1700-2269(+)